MATKQRRNRRTGWTILIVPPNPLRKTRAVHIRRRHLRAALAIAGLCTLTMAALGVVVLSDSLQVTATADELADAHQMILTLTDSLQAVADLDMPESDTEGGSGAAHNVKNAVAHARTTEIGLARPARRTCTLRFAYVASRLIR